MKTWMQRIIYEDDGHRFNPLAHIFFYLTFAFGFAFTFFYHTDSVRMSPLLQATDDLLGERSLPIWGLCAIIVTVANTVAVVRRIDWLVVTAAMGGFAIWLFALIMYAQSGSWFQLLVGAVPNMVFWAWYYLNIKASLRGKRP